MNKRTSAIIVDVASFGLKRRIEKEGDNRIRIAVNSHRLLGIDEEKKIMLRKLKMIFRRLGIGYKRWRTKIRTKIKIHILERI